MRFRKTSREKRETYRQFDETGRCIYEFIPETDEDREMVRKMHAIDDAEVRTNCKEMRLPPELKKVREAERQQYIEKFEEENGYKPHPLDCPSVHRTFFYYDAVRPNPAEDEANVGDSSWIEKEMAVMPFEDENAAVNYMRELINTDTFTDRERNVYYCVFADGKTQYLASSELGISEARVSQIVKNIQIKLAKNEQLRKFFRFEK